MESEGVIESLDTEDIINIVRGEAGDDEDDDSDEGGGATFGLFGAPVEEKEAVPVEEERVGGGGAPGGGGEEVEVPVNPYHQAWSSRPPERLALVRDWGVATLAMGEDTIDMMDFQQNQADFPPNFFTFDLRTGVQRVFRWAGCRVQGCRVQGWLSTTCAGAWCAG